MANPRPETLEQVKLLLRRDLKLGPDIPIPDDMPFSGTEADFDSLDILLLLSSIEKQFKIKIPSEAVGQEIFRNVSTLADYIDRRTHESAADAAPDPLLNLPHRDPFRFVSKVTALVPGESGEGVWSANGTEPFFAGHFPDNPLVPGVLLAEALAQFSGLLVPTSAHEGKLVHVDVRFDQSVRPPADIVLRSKLLRAVGMLQQFEVSAAVGDQIVARGMLTLSRPESSTPGAAL